MNEGVSIWINEILSALKYLSSDNRYMQLLRNNDFEGLTKEVFKKDYSFIIPSIEQNKEVILDRELLKYTLFVLLLKGYKKINNSNKQYFYKFYDLFATTGMHSIDADVIEQLVQSNSVEIPVNDYYSKINGPSLKRGSDPNFTVNYIIDESFNLEQINILLDVFSWLRSVDDIRVNVVFPKNTKFKKPLDFESFSDLARCVDKLTITFYAEKNENGDYCLPFEIKYLPEDREYLDKILKPIL